MTLSTALWARLAGDLTLAGMLATYQGDPAVIVGDEGALPGDLDPPFVVIHGSDQDFAADTKQDDGREVLRPIRCYTTGGGSTLEVEAIAERVRELLHRQPDGLLPGAYVAECEGPTVAPTDPQFYGRQVLLRLTTLVVTQP